MNVLSRCLVFLGLLLLALGNPSCKQEEKAKKKDGSNTGTGSRTDRDDDDDDEGGDDDPSTDTGGTNTQTGTAPSIDPCLVTGGGTSTATSSATGSATSTDTATDDGLTLRRARSSHTRQAGALLQAGNLSYDGGVKAVLQSKCVGCHGAGSMSGDFSTYAKAKEAAALIKSEVEGGSMPPLLSQPLTAAEKTMIVGWVDAGAPQTAQAGTETDTDTDTDSSTDTDVTGGDDDDAAGGGDPCAPENGDASDAPTIDELFADLLGEKERQECAGRDLLFDRKTKTCQEGVVLAKSYQCTREGVIGKFNELKTPGSDKIFDQYIADGFTLDQCGERNGRPVINFYKRVDNGGDEAVLQQRYLCASGDPLCTKKN